MHAGEDAEGVTSFEAFGDLLADVIGNHRTDCGHECTAAAMQPVSDVIGNQNKCMLSLCVRELARCWHYGRPCQSQRVPVSAMHKVATSFLENGRTFCPRLHSTSLSPASTDSPWRTHQGSAANYLHIPSSSMLPCPVDTACAPRCRHSPLA